MTKNFILDSNLSQTSVEITDLTLSQVRLVNNQNFLWILLIPRKNNLRELIDLDFQDQIELLKEINVISQVLKNLKINSKNICEKINIASLGNMTPQLHIHVIARHQQDHCWPQAPFGQESQPYEKNELEILIKNLQENLKK